MYVFRHGYSNLMSFLKQEVELVVFLRMRSNTKNAENATKMRFEGIISCVIYVFRNRESESKARFETGGRTNGFYGHAVTQKCHSNSISRPTFSRMRCFGTRNPNLISVLKSEIVYLVLVRKRSDKSKKMLF